MKSANHSEKGFPGCVLGHQKNVKPIRMAVLNPVCEWVLNLRWHQDLWAFGESRTGEEAPSKLGIGTGIWPLSRVGNCKKNKGKASWSQIGVLWLNPGIRQNINWFKVPRVQLENHGLELCFGFHCMSSDHSDLKTNDITGISVVWHFWKWSYS